MTTKTEDLQARHDKLITILQEKNSECVDLKAEVHRLSEPPPVPLIHTLMPQLMGKIGAIGKERVNNQLGFNFRGIDDVLNVISPAMVELGMSLSVECTDHKLERFDVESKGMVKVREVASLMLHVTFYAPDGSSRKNSMPGEAWDTNGDKATNKAGAAAMKYCCFFGCAIPLQEIPDADGDDKHEGGTVSYGARASSAPAPQGSAPRTAGGSAQPKREYTTPSGGKDYKGSTNWGRDASDAQKKAMHAIAKEQMGDAEIGHEFMRFVAVRYCDGGKDFSLSDVKIGQASYILDLMQGKNHMLDMETAVTMFESQEPAAAGAAADGDCPF